MRNQTTIAGHSRLFSVAADAIWKEIDPDSELAVLPDRYDKTQFEELSRIMGGPTDQSGSMTFALGFAAQAHGHNSHIPRSQACG
jgi:hypothetical protein